MVEVFDIDTRKKIYNLIAKNPGLHAKRIAEILSIQGQLVDYHLLFLERNNLVSAVREKGYTWYYIKGKLGMRERRRIAILRQEIPLKIVLYILEHPHARQKEINDEIPIAKSTLSYHLHKLCKQQIVTVEPQGRERYYDIADREEIIRLLIQYKPSDQLEHLKDIWSSMKWPGAP
jgi:predicted transcriptional regulator